MSKLRDQKTHVSGVQNERRYSFQETSTGRIFDRMLQEQISLHRLFRTTHSLCIITHVRSTGQYNTSNTVSCHHCLAKKGTRIATGGICAACASTVPYAFSRKVAKAQKGQRLKLRMEHCAVVISILLRSIVFTSAAM